ncbi:hypothetical protein K438DRAFT_2059150 [Mycena galopus ATCC 62051]|nr:hypothetical protein K438DRAFT_2059150 [Mycena galopus ATCC 62051]
MASALNCQITTCIRLRRSPDSPNTSQIHVSADSANLRSAALWLHVVDRPLSTKALNAVITAYGVDSPAVLGIMEIGVFLSLVMFGVVTLQGYIYFQNCRGNRTGLKLLVNVGSLLFFELCHSVASCHAIFYFTVFLAGIPELQKPANSYSLSLIPVFETIITAIVQSPSALEGILIPTPGILDALIAVSLCFYIQKLYTPYNLPRGEELIQGLIAWTIETGLITSHLAGIIHLAGETLNARSPRRSIARAPCPMPTRSRSPNVTIQISRIVEDDLHTLGRAAGSLQVPEKVVYNKTPYALCFTHTNNCGTPTQLKFRTGKMPEKPVDNSIFTFIGAMKRKLAICRGALPTATREHMFETHHETELRLRLSQISFIPPRALQRLGLAKYHVT